MATAPFSKTPRSCALLSSWRHDGQDRRDKQTTKFTTPPWSNRNPCWFLSFAVSCYMMAEGINSFAYKYCLSSLAATVAETGINSVGCHIFKRQVRILTWHISHDIIWSWPCFCRGDTLRATRVFSTKDFNFIFKLYLLQF